MSLRNGTNMKMTGNRVCMFCEAQSCTKEHVWPNWLLQHFTSENARVFGERRGDDLGDWHGKAGLQVRRFCASCNNGWMSTLENATKPLVESFWSDQVSSLAPSECTILAQWTVKTAMVIEGVEPETRWFYLQDERRRLRESQTIPQRTTVEIAKCVSHPHIYTAASEHWAAGDATAVRAHVTTFAFGTLALQVVTIRVPAEIPPHIDVTYDVSEGPWDTILIQIWPPNAESLSWPPKGGLNGDAGLDALTKRLTLPRP